MTTTCIGIEIKYMILFLNHNVKIEIGIILNKRVIGPKYSPVNPLSWP